MSTKDNYVYVNNGNKESIGETIQDSIDYFLNEINSEQNDNDGEEDSFNPSHDFTPAFYHQSVKGSLISEGIFNLETWRIWRSRIISPWYSSILDSLTQVINGKIFLNQIYCIFHLVWVLFTYYLYPPCRKSEGIFHKVEKRNSIDDRTKLKIDSEIKLPLKMPTVAMVAEVLDFL